MSKRVDNVIGKGLSYPNVFSKRSGQCRVQEGINKINQSISDILSTRRGQRVLRPDYGSEIHNLIFDPHDTLMYDILAIMVHEAITEFETRVIIDDIDIYPDEFNEHRLTIEIHYTIRNSNLEEIHTYYFNPQSVGY